MAKTRLKKDSTPPALRCDKLPTFMNPGKVEALKSMLSAWRKSAKTIARLQWSCFYREGAFDPFFDPATAHRKAGAEVRRGVLHRISRHFGVEPTEFKKKRLPAMIGGLNDVLAPMKAILGAAEVQSVSGQVLSTLNGFVSNRQNEFRQAVFESSLCGEQHTRLRHELFVINKVKAWFDLDRPLRIDGQPIDIHSRRLARNIMSQIMGRHRKPRFNRIGMVVDQRIATLEAASDKSHFDMWLTLRVAGLKQQRGAAGVQSPDNLLRVPIKTYDRFEARKGERKRSFQIIEDRRTGKISVGVVTDVGGVFAASREAYAAKDGNPLALDFGLDTMFASDMGDLFGRDFLRKLKAMDETLSGIARHVRRAGGKPRDSKRYVMHVDRTRGYIRTEINRVINRLVRLRRPSKLYLERLDFRSPQLSRRMNRILQNCGRSALQAKLKAIKEEFGVETNEVVSAYTSQTCCCCGYADKRNRKEQARFKCLWCGSTSHADVNAARNVGSERFRSLPTLRAGFRKAVLDTLVSGHVERNKRRPGSPSDPRDTNLYFKERWPEVRLTPCEAIAEQGKVGRIQLDI